MLMEESLIIRACPCAELGDVAEEVDRIIGGDGVEPVPSNEDIEGVEMLNELRALDRLPSIVYVC